MEEQDLKPRDQVHLKINMPAIQICVPYPELGRAPSCPAAQRGTTLSCQDAPTSMPCTLPGPISPPFRQFTP